MVYKTYRFQNLEGLKGADAGFGAEAGTGALEGLVSQIATLTALASRRYRLRAFA
jgi:hypothetical protein